LAASDEASVCRDPLSAGRAARGRTLPTPASSVRRRRPRRHRRLRCGFVAACGFTRQVRLSGHALQAAPALAGASPAAGQRIKLPAARPTSAAI